MDRISNCLKIIDPLNNLNSEQITNWAVGENEVDTNFTEQELIDEALNSNITVSEESAESDVNENVGKVKHGDARNAFSLCLRWSE